MSKQVKLSLRTNIQLDALSEKRKKDGSAIKYKQAIIAELVEREYKKEIK
jgi:hypothetical protein